MKHTRSLTEFEGFAREKGYKVERGIAILGQDGDAA